MKPFAFNLEKILELRQYREREAEIELGRAMGALQEIENRIKAVAAERFRAAGEQFLPGNSADLMRDYEFYLRRLDAEAEQLAKAAAAAELKVEEARELFLEASRERKILDKLKEKRKQDYRKFLSREEIKFLDDISAGIPARGNIQGSVE